MFNLLPNNLKQIVKNNYRLRFWVLALGMVICVEVSVLILLFPSWLDSFYREKSAVSETEKLNQSLQTTDAQTVTVMIGDINTKLDVINLSLEYPKTVPIVNAILSRKTKGISITEFAYSDGNATEASISLGGVSADRESLVSFAKSLQDSGVFKSVDLPISNFTKDSNIKFSITMNIAP